MSSSSFNVIRRHSLDQTGVRIRELTQALADRRSDIANTQLETDDVRSIGRMNHSTIKLNDERLSFMTLVPGGNTSFFYEFITEPDLNFLKVWFMLDHLGARIRDISGFGNHAFVSGHPTLRRVPLNLGYIQTSAAPGTSAMLFNSGTDVVSKTDGEYLFILDNPSIQFSQFAAGFSIAFRFNCSNFNIHQAVDGGTYSRRIAQKADDANNGWSVIVFADSDFPDGSRGYLEFEIKHAGVNYSLSTDVFFVKDAWYQVIITYNPTAGATSALRIKIYIAGVNHTQASTFGTILPTHTNLRIGARDSQTGFFHGYIQDFRMYMGKVLTQTEVTNLNTNETTIDNVTKGRMFIIQYAQVLSVYKSTRHRYKIGWGVGPVTKTHRWNSIGRVRTTKTHRWNIVTKVATRIRTHRYAVLGKVLTTKTHRWHQEGKISVLKTHRWVSGGKVSTIKTHKWIVQATTPVGNVRTHRWNILNKVVATKTHKYNVPQASLTLWNVADTSTGHTIGTSTSKVGTRVTSTLHPLYNKIVTEVTVKMARGSASSTGTVYCRIYSEGGATVLRTLGSVNIQSIGTTKQSVVFSDSENTIALTSNRYLVIEYDDGGNFASSIYYNNSNAVANAVLDVFVQTGPYWTFYTGNDFAAVIKGYNAP